MAEIQGKFKSLLKNKGLKITNQRLAVLDVLNSRPGQHLTVEEIHEYLKESNLDIGVATVYRTIQLLTELNLIEKLNLEDGYVRYEIGDKGEKNSHRHHHLICLKCGEVSSFEDDLLDNLENKILSTRGFKVKDHEVKLFGFCSQCRKAT